jgi:hypothetical protein
MKRLLVLAALAAAVAAPAAHATNECRGLMVCVPVAGPWVLASSAVQVQYDLTCPKRYVVAGLDAELSTRGIDIGFIGTLGSPVNPGITTSRDAVFLGRLVRGRVPAASFRPHIGCVPASGGGQRAPTAYNPNAIPPGKTVDRQVREVPATPSRTVRARCPSGERLSSATHAIGFYGQTPPSAKAARAVHVTQTIRNGVVAFTIRSKAQAVVQLDLICVAK